MPASHAADLERRLPRAARSPIPSGCAWPRRWGEGRGGRAFRIRATDISTRVLYDRAARGLSGRAFSANCRRPGVARIFCAGKARARGSSSSSRKSRRRVEFQRLNLIEPFPDSRLFHVIFCRNVMMYFDKATQQDIVQRLSRSARIGRVSFCGPFGIAHRRGACAALRAAGRVPREKSLGGAAAGAVISLVVGISDCKVSKDPDAALITYAPGLVHRGGVVRPGVQSRRACCITCCLSRPWMRPRPSRIPACSPIRALPHYCRR